MKSLVFNMALALGLLQSIVPTTAETTGTQATFAAKLFSTIAEEHLKENVIISPASIQTALALTYIGAEGNTANELRQGLHLGANDISKEQVGQQFGNLMSKMRSSGNATFKMANRIYVRNGLDIAPKFNDVAQRDFASVAENVNFADNVNTAKKINTWVEEQTENRIHDLIPSDLLDQNTAAVLVNAIYFKATWINTFMPAIKGDFHLSAKSTKKVDIMFQEGLFPFAELADLDAKVLSMGYIDTDIRMLVLLPNKVDGLGQLEQQLKEVDLAKLLNTLKVNYGQVFLPKFKIEFGIKLVETLQKLGMRDLFSEKADFSSLFASKEKFFVSEVLHKAFIMVDETGTEAAGSTAVGVSKLIHIFPQFIFNVSHPFYFALLDDDTVYFAGHVADI